MMDNLVVFENENFMVKQCLDVSIPGYLIIEPKIEVYYLSDLSQDVLQLLTSLITKVEKVLREVLEVEKIYIAKFAELNKVLHFHIFPRTDSIFHAYIQDNPSTRDQISGPLIFDWSRKYYKTSVETLKEDKTIIDTLSAIRQKLKST
jgi:diadenosine tetraphosphate (Ap4A) HIT family hydrolase